MIDWRPECAKQSWGTDAGAFTGGPTKIVMHSTETIAFPGYYSDDGVPGMKAPHETWRWDAALLRFEKRQHIPHTLASRALKNLDGGIQTNRDGAHQVELVGYCDKITADSVDGRYLPGQGDAYLRELGREIRELAKDIGLTDLTLAGPWERYDRYKPQSAGVRMTNSEWDDFTGICGHEHVPENNHRDPGDLNIPRALSLSDPEDDMTPDEVTRAVYAATTKALSPDGSEESFLTAFAREARNQRWQNDQIKLLAAQVADLSAKVDKLATGTAPTAAAIADELAKRMEA